MDIDELIGQLEETVRKRSRRVNNIHVRSITEKMGALHVILKPFAAYINKYHQRCYLNSMTGNHEIILESWIEHVGSTFRKALVRISQIEDISDERKKEISDQLTELEADLLSDKLSILREDDDYKLLELTLNILKELRDSVREHQ